MKYRGLLSLLAFCLFLFSGSAENMPSKTKIMADHSAWVASCLSDFESIKLGVERKDIQKRFSVEQGGFYTSRSPVRFIHPACPYFKIDVTFDEQGKATQISKPYIELTIVD